MRHDVPHPQMPSLLAELAAAARCTSQAKRSSASPAPAPKLTLQHQIQRSLLPRHAGNTLLSRPKDFSQFNFFPFLAIFFLEKNKTQNQLHTVQFLDSFLSYTINEGFEEVCFSRRQILKKYICS